MATNEKLTEVLNDLVKINNDRVNGYEKAAEETKGIDADMQALFYSMANDSKKHVEELKQEISNLGGKATTNTTNVGKIYRIWMDVKVTFTGDTKKAVLSSCEFGEDAAQKAYKEALASDAEMSANVRQVITTQQASLKKSHDLIKKYRDMHQ